jgi:hypothetical protein
MTEERVLLHSASLKAITLYHEYNTLNDIRFQPAQLKAPNHGVLRLAGLGVWISRCF